MLRCFRRAFTIYRPTFCVVKSEEARAHGLEVSRCETSAHIKVTDVNHTMGNAATENTRKSPAWKTSGDKCMTIVPPQTARETEIIDKSWRWTRSKTTACTSFGLPLQTSREVPNTAYFKWVHNDTNSLMEGVKSADC